MLGWALTFLIIAIIAGVLGFTGIAGTAAWIAKVLFVFLIVFVISLIFGKRPPPALATARYKQATDSYQKSDLVRISALG